MKLPIFIAILAHPFALTLVAEEKWHQKYISLESPTSDRFIKEGLAYAESLYGKAKIPVTKVNLRLSQPIRDENIRKNFQLTETTDPAKGIFTIYLSRRPNEYSYHGQLAHEIGHLLNSRLMDAYMEGLCTLFSEKYLKRNNMDWSGWEKWYKDDSNGDRFYASTYFMMREINATLGDEAMRNFLDFAEETPNRRGSMHINIEKWLASLPASQKSQAKEIILEHAPVIKRHLQAFRHDILFQLPKDN